MFEIAPILWQQLASPVLDLLMLSVSWLGYSAAYGVLLLVLGFAVRLRPALLLMLILVPTSAATHVIKDTVALPRPSDVDARVLDNTKAHRSLAERGASTSFRDLPTPAAVAALRGTADPDDGFVSGHTSAAAALAFGVLLGFRIGRRWLRCAVLAWPLLLGLATGAVITLALRTATPGRSLEPRRPELMVALALLEAWRCSVPAECPGRCAAKRWAWLSPAWS